MPSPSGSATRPSTSARLRSCRSARPASSAFSRSAAKTPSASIPTWARCTYAGSESSVRQASQHASNPDGKLAHEYLDALKHQRRLSPATLSNYARALDVLLALREGEPLRTLEPSEVRRSIAMLHAKGLSPRTLALILSAWRGWYRWLGRHRDFALNPVVGIRAPKAGRPLPKALSVEATQRLLDVEKDARPTAIRDRAMFELLYSSGL